MGMVSPKYVWLLPAAVSSSWIFSPRRFHLFYKNTVCNMSQIIEAADGFIIADKLPIRQDNNRTFSGLVRRRSSLSVATKMSILSSCNKSLCFIIRSN